MRQEKVILVFKTSIQSLNDVNKVSKLLRNHQKILRFSFDLEDRDKILKLECFQAIQLQSLLDSLRGLQISCEELS